MKKEIIKTQDYLLVVDDSEIKKGDWFYQINLNKIVKHNLKNGLLLQPQSFDKKIIAHLPLKDTLTFEGVPLLPPLEVEDDIEKLNEDLFDKGSDNVLHPQYQMRTFFNIGYNKAKEKYKYTEEDVAKAVMFGRWGATDKISYNNFIQSLHQPSRPTHFEFEVVVLRERPTDIRNHIYDKTYEVPKTTTNSEGQQVACGKYIY